MRKTKYLLPVLTVLIVGLAYGFGGSFAQLGGSTNATLTLSPEPTQTYTGSPSPTETASTTPVTSSPTATPVASSSATATPAASTSSDAPANTVACDQIHSAADFPQTNNYSPPYNLISAPGENMIKAFCDPDVNVTIQAGSSKSSDYVYDSGYVFRDNQWVQIALNRPNPNVQKIEEHWFNTVATTTFAMPSGKLNSESFFLAFLCHWSDNKWKCGCSDAACATPKWNVQVFQRK